MSVQSNTKNPYMIQFKTPTACNCSDDCTCAQCVVENTSGLGDFMKNAAGAAKDLVRTPFKVVSAIGNSVKMSKVTAQRIATKWRNKGAIEPHNYDLAVHTLLDTNSEKDAREELRSMHPQVYFTEKDRKLTIKREKQELLQSHTNRVSEEEHKGLISKIMHHGNQQRIQQERAKEVQEAQHKSGLFGMFGHNKPAAVSKTPASSHGIMPHFSMPHVFSGHHVSRPHVTMPHMPHVIMPGRMHEACESKLFK